MTLLAEATLVQKGRYRKVGTVETYCDKTKSQIWIKSTCLKKGRVLIHGRQNILSNSSHSVLGQYVSYELAFINHFLRTSERLVPQPKIDCKALR